MAGASQVVPTLARVRTVQDAAGEALAATSMDDKLALTRAARADWDAGRLAVDDGAGALPPDARGRPPRPELVDPRRLRTRDLRLDTGAAGTSTRVSTVEKIRPPITVMPIGARQLLSPLIEIAVGNMPATMATVVMTIGWARL